MTNKTTIVMSLLFFSATMLFFYGLLGNFVNEDIGLETQEKSNNLLNFSFSLVTGIEIMPSWFNTLILGSITSGVVWIIVSSFVPSGS